jgi:hypothetical protein
MLRFLACALPLNLIWGFETTSNKSTKRISGWQAGQLIVTEFWDSPLLRMREYNVLF